MSVEAKQLETLNDKNTIVIIPDVQLEHKVVMEWLKQNAPKTLKEGRVFTELDTNTLTRGTSIMAVFHDPDYNLVEYVTNNAGNTVHVPRKQAELKDEIIVTQPVKLDDSNWALDPDRPMRATRPNTNKFLNQLNATLMPKRMEYCDKGEKKPSLMKLEPM